MLEELFSSRATIRDIATKARSKSGPKQITRLTKDEEAEQTSSLLEKLFRGRATTRDIATKARRQERSKKLGLPRMKRRNKPAAS